MAMGAFKKTVLIPQETSYISKTPNDEESYPYFELEIESYISLGNTTNLTLTSNFINCLLNTTASILSIPLFHVNYVTYNNQSSNLVHRLDAIVDSKIYISDVCSASEGFTEYSSILEESILDSDSYRERLQNCIISTNQSRTQSSESDMLEELKAFPYNVSSLLLNVTQLTNTTVYCETRTNAPTILPTTNAQLNNIQASSTALSGGQTSVFWSVYFLMWIVFLIATIIYVFLSNSRRAWEDIDAMFGTNSSSTEVRHATHASQSRNQDNLVALGEINYEVTPRAIERPSDPSYYANSPMQFIQPLYAEPIGDDEQTMEFDNEDEFNINICVRCGTESDSESPKFGTSSSRSNSYSNDSDRALYLDDYSSPRSSIR